MEVVDAHQHVGSLGEVLGGVGEGSAALSLEEEIQNRVRVMTEIGITWAVIQPSHGYLKPEGIRDTMRVNDEMASYRRRDSAHFPIALGTVEPTHGERSLEEIDRVKDELGLNGLSWHHRFQGCFIDNKWMYSILRRMADRKLVPFIHTNPESTLEAPWRLQRLAQEFPELTFVALDPCFSYAQTMEILHLAAGTPNILWDIATGGWGTIEGGWSAIEGWVRHHGSERIVYSAGGGVPIGARSTGSVLLKAILESDLRGEDKANILGRNIRRVFGMPLEA